MRLMIVGDTHGNAGAVEYKARIAQAMGVEHLFVVGDFGLWTGHEGVVYLDDVNAIAREYKVQVTALPGNHEDHDQWDKWFDIAPIHKELGFAIIRSNLRLTKKVHPFKLGGKRFYVCGGAVSIDKSQRKQGRDWWPNETFSEEHLASVEKYKGPAIDYLLTHDASDYTNWGFRLKPDLDSQANRRRIDRAIAALRPRRQFHGHMHEKYEWVNTRSHGQRNSAFGTDDSEWNGCATVTYGLECDYDKNSWVILDTGAHKGDPDKVYWPGHAYAALLDDYLDK